MVLKKVGEKKKKYFSSFKLHRHLFLNENCFLLLNLVENIINRQKRQQCIQLQKFCEVQSSEKLLFHPSPCPRTQNAPLFHIFPFTSERSPTYLEARRAFRSVLMKGLLDFWWILPFWSFPFSSWNSAAAAFGLRCYLLFNSTSLDNRWDTDYRLTPNAVPSSAVRHAACISHFGSNTEDSTERVLWHCRGPWLSFISCLEKKHESNKVSMHRSSQETSL